MLLIPKNGKSISSLSLFLYKLSIFLNIIKCIMPECTNRDQPFFKSGSCASTCTITDINNNICSVENEIIKKQWFNNIIDIGGQGCAFVNVVTSEKNNFYYLATAYPESNDRTLYLLNEKGYGMLDEDNPKIIKELNDAKTKGRFESDTFIMKLYESTDDKEYLVSLAKSDQYIEIYDFYNNIIYFNQTIGAFPPLGFLFSIFGAHFKLNTTDNRNTYLIGLLACEYPQYLNYDEEPHIYLYITKFLSLNVKSIRPEFVCITYKSSKSKIFSCFETYNHYIVCFYQNEEFNYIMKVFSYKINEIKEINSKPIAEGFDDTDYEEWFFKCVHFFGETGVFGYFDEDEDKFVFEFKTYTSDNKIIDSFAQFKLNNYEFSHEKVTLCDMVKIKDNKVYFAGTTRDKDKLILVSIVNYDDVDLAFREYVVNIKNLYGHPFSESIRLESYKNFLVLASSYWEEADLKSHSNLIILSYPQTIHTSLDLVDYIYYQNDKN